ncbi:lysylphosphatidylglycerol synthase domain-containing protein [Mariniflexile sp. AS56]|uniref:lysylphosphatidylglycerol synthase domain-containing protein n=1 Tax=Mariniflexile sp. AS56 TaxID=3063957 RepID=UPI0026F2800C|nr:lysylphosphatidylglycerol synthase domain-containing protein [Mariniflexile sp. AS56]MDO7170886.1 lysylphosphatidylglycerol synthase domain-containing protein [Mariniflexile sp. AS56]
MIYTLPYKTKQFFFVLIKISIVVAAFYFIYRKLAYNSSLEFSNFIDILNEHDVFSAKTILILIILTGFNWFFEILKWQKLVSPINKITFQKASQQSLGALTASLFTPNRIGDYGAKAIYYTKNLRKRILLTNLLSNILQMGVTCILGCIGLYFFISKYAISLNYNKLLLRTLFTLACIGFVFFVIQKSRFSIKGFSFEKMKVFLLNYPKKLLIYGFCLSLLRYLIFSFQFYYLLTIFGVNNSYLESMTLITSMYLLASIIPSIFIFDVLIKGSVAVYLFSFIGINAISILCIVTLMWVLNFVFPSILGSYFVLNFNFPKNDL